MKKLLFILLLLPCLSFGTVTYNFYEYASDCGSSSFGNERMKLAKPASFDTIVVGIPGDGGNHTGYFRTIAGAPNNVDWETGAFTVKLKIVGYAETPQIKIRIGRENSGCTVQEFSAYSSTITIDSTGIYTFSIVSKDWSVGATGDRMIVAIDYLNGLFQNADTVKIEVGTSNSSVETSVSDYYGYVNVVDTVWGTDLWDASIFGYSDCNSEISGEECKKYNTGVNTGSWIGAGKVLTKGPMRYLFKDKSGKAISGLDSVHFQFHVRSVQSTSSYNLIFYSINETNWIWEEGNETFGYPSSYCGVTWNQSSFDSTNPGICNYAWGTAGGSYDATVACTVSVADTGFYTVTNFLTLLEYADSTAGMDSVMQNGFLVIGDEATSSSWKSWQSSEYITDVNLRPMIIRYGKVKKFYHYKTTPGTGQTDTVITGDSTQIDSKINLRRWHYYNDSAYMKIDLNSVSAFIENRGDTLERLTTLDTMVQHEFIDMGDSVLEWFIILTDSTGDTAFTYPIETFNLTFVDQTFDTTHSIIDTFGYTSTPGTKRGLNKDNKQGSKFTLPEAAIIDTVVVYSKTGGGAQAPFVYKILIYSDNAGAPDTLIATSNEATVNSTAQWRKVTFSSEVFLDSGDYWLVSHHGTKIDEYFDAGATNQRAYNADTYSDGGADPFGTPTYTAEKMGTYAIYREWSQLDSFVQNYGLDTAYYFNLFDSNGAYGAWTVRHSSKKDNITRGAVTEKFFSGNAFVIDRPYIFKWSGTNRTNKLECWLDIDTTNDSITISVPKSYLDSCTYPVVIAPTFGFMPTGKLNKTDIVDYVSTPHWNNMFIGSIPADSIGIIDSISIYLDGKIKTGDTQTISIAQVSVYKYTGTQSTSTLLGTSDTVVFYGPSKAYVNVPIGGLSTDTMQSSTNYILMNILKDGQGSSYPTKKARQYFSIGLDLALTDNIGSWSAPANLGNYALDPRVMALYANYTLYAAGATSPAIVNLRHSPSGVGKRHSPDGSSKRHIP